MRARISRDLKCLLDWLAIYAIILMLYCYFPGMQ